MVYDQGLPYRRPKIYLSAATKFAHLIIPILKWIGIAKAKDPHLTFLGIFIQYLKLVKLVIFARQPTGRQQISRA